MKTFLVLLIGLFGVQASATDFYCDAKRGYEVHQSFCENLSQSACRVHSSLCELYEYKDIGCYAHPGHEVHQPFCENLDRHSCDVHSGVCEWNWRRGWR